MKLLSQEQIRDYSDKRVMLPLSGGINSIYDIKENGKMRRMREDVNKETHSNALGVSVQECECCGHPKHGLSDECLLYVMGQIVSH